MTMILELLAVLVIVNTFTKIDTYMMYVLTYICTIFRIIILILLRGSKQPIRIFTKNIPKIQFQLIILFLSKSTLFFVRRHFKKLPIEGNIVRIIISEIHLS